MSVLLLTHEQHRNIVANTTMNHIMESQHLSWTGGKDGKGDKLIAFLPFYHIYGRSASFGFV